ncbi:PAS domain S-box protein [Actinoplanes sp. CA-252034]|uniref:PAS domain-containing hybrid sensor histidine kinase/response regulator n=1 Tax=Actinoplanes sp. CA-252034 TaxID=3239906 RepID=UPI003D984F9C
MTVSSSRRTRRGRLWRTATITALLLGVFGLVDNLLSLRLARHLPGEQLMSLPSAVMTCAAAIALLIAGPVRAGTRQRWAVRLIAVFVAGSAVSTLADNLATTATGQPPMRSPVAFLLIGLALLLMENGRRRGHLPAQLLAAAAALVMGVAAFAALLGLAALYWDTPARITPPGTQAALLLLALAVTISRPGALAVQIFGSGRLGSRTVRRLAPTVAAVVVLLGLSLAVMKRNHIDLEGVVANIVVSVLLLTLYLVLLRAGHMLNDADAGRLRLIAELREQHDFSDTVLTALIEGVMAVAPDGTVLRVNERWTQITGFPAGEAIGSRPPYPWWPPEGSDNCARQLKHVLESGRSSDFGANLRHRNGTDLPVLASIHPIAPAGQVSILIVTYRDLTERDREQAQRRQMAEELDHFFTLSRDLMCMASRDGIFTRINPPWTEVLGWTAEELTSRPYLEFIHPDDVDRTVAQNSSLVDGLMPTISFENRYRTRDGGYRWLAWNATPAEDGACIYAVARDVTEAKRAEQRFRQLVFSAPDAMVIVGADGVIRLVNEQTERLFGWADADLVGRPVHTLIPARLHTRHAEDMRHYLEDPVSRRMGVGRELSALRRDGSEFPVEITIAPLDTEEGLLVSAAIRDVSERQRTEKALAAARDEALAAAAAKSQFVAMVSHEIRTPMNGVIGLTKLLLDTPLQPVQRRYGESIRASAQALLAIINDILDFSKIEAGKITLTEQDFDLGDLLEQVAHAGAAAARDKAIEIIGCYPPDLPVTVHGDEGRLRQVLLNLVGNAVKFTHRGEIVIRVDPDGRGPDDGDRRRYDFSVADTGIGIDAGQISRMFEPFTQADATNSREFGGTGLGLAISRQLVELMGGTLHVDSRPGHGSRFHFTLPLEIVQPAADPHRRHRSLAGRRLLIADSNPTSRSFLTEHVQAWGMRVTVADSATAALDQLGQACRRGEPHDIAVIDHHLTRLDGVELITVMGAQPEIDPRPFCVLLSRDPSTEHRLTDHTGVDVLAKPLGPSVLFDYLMSRFGPVGPAHEERDGPSPAPAGEPRGRILLAEDNEINQLVAVDTLAGLGYDTDVAANGAEAVELAATGDYVAILMDCQMPRLDGYQATEQLRANEDPGHHTPIIAMTAGVLAEDRRRALQAGMDDFLAKPIDPDKLRAALDHWTHV